jgi:hypothetical protein
MGARRDEIQNLYKFVFAINVRRDRALKIQEFS